MKFNASLAAALVLFALPGAALAQFTDTFDTINSAWVLNRYAPAGFASVIFDGDSRLQLTIDQTGSTANRDPTFSAPFYNTQGEQRAGGITGLWTLSAQVYVASTFNTTTGALAKSDLWGHTGTTPGGGDYAILGFTNASPTDTLNPNPAAGDRTFRFEAFNVVTGGWIDLGVPAGFAFDAWHTLSEISTGTTFEYLIDGTLYLTQPTTAGNDLLSAMVQGYNFDGTGNYSYSVDWDNVTASAIPEPATSAFIAAIGVLTLACWSRRRGELKRAGAVVFTLRFDFSLRGRNPPPRSAVLFCRWFGLSLRSVGFSCHPASFLSGGNRFLEPPNEEAVPRCDEVGVLGDVKPMATDLFVVNIGKLGAMAERAVRDDAGCKDVGDLCRPADCRWPAHVVGVFNQIEKAPWRSIEQGLVEDDPAKVIAAAGYP